MLIELKKISINLSFSQETIMFKADLYINGKNVGYAKNDGHGGPTSYGPNKIENLALIKEAEKYCKALPPDVNSFGTFSMDLEYFIDNIIDGEVKKKEEDKFAKRLLKDCLNGICYGTPTKYYQYYWKSNGKKIAIQHMLSSPKGVEALSKGIKTIKAKLEKDQKILNTNIPSFHL